MNDVLFLAPQDVEKMLTIEDCIGAVENAFRAYGEGKAAAPGVLGVHVAAGGFHIKAGVLESGRNYFAAKVNGNFPENPNRFGLPTIQGVIVLCDADNGTPLAVMDSRYITAVRTAAATAVAAKYLARANARTVAICGCGAQGRVQLAALCHACKIEKAHAFDTNTSQLAPFVEEMQMKLQIPVMPHDVIATALRESDIVVTCTTSRAAIVFAEHLRPGMFLAAVGADNPHKQELAPEAMAKAKIVCDVTDQCAVMGDLHHAIERGVVTQSDVHAELGEIVAGKKAGRETPEEITIFDSTGMALQDVAAAAVVFERARQHRIGVSMSFAA